MRNPNGYGCVVYLGKRRRKPYGVRLTVGYDDNGKQKYKYLSYHEKRIDALNALSEYNVGKLNINKMDTTFADLFNEFYKKQENKVTDSTLEWYSLVKKKIKPLLDMSIKDAKLIDLQKIIDPYSPNTQRRIKGVLSQMFDIAIANDITNKNYAQYLTLKKLEKSTKHKPFSNDEVNMLWDNLTLNNVDIVLIMIYSGVRPNELLKLENENIFISDNYFITGSKTDAGTDRYIPINSKIKDLIINRMSDNKYFLNEKNIYKFTKSHMRGRFDKVCQQLKMEHTPHDCRHTFISMMKKADADPLYLKRIVGHADNNITDKVYTHTDIEQLQSTIELI